MVRRINEYTPNLMGVWHLENGPEEGFNSHVSWLTGTGVSFQAVHAPVYDFDPIVIPRVEERRAPDHGDVNGECAPWEYGHLRLPIWFGTDWNALNFHWVKVGATEDDLYIFAEGLEAVTYAFYNCSVLLDPAHDRSERIETDDRRVFIRKNGVSTYHAGTEIGFFGTSSGDYTAATNISEFSQGAEFRIPRDLLPSDSTFGMAVGHFGAFEWGTIYAFPMTTTIIGTHTWESFTFSDSDLPRPDGQIPTVDIHVTNTGTISPGDLVYFEVEARDDVDITSLDLYVDGFLVESQPLLLENNTDETWTFVKSFETLGAHTYYARVRDHRDQVGHSVQRRFFVQLDGDAPTVEMSTSSTTEFGTYASLPVDFSVTETDPSGIRSMRIWADSRLILDEEAEEGHLGSTVRRSGTYDPHLTGPGIVRFRVTVEDNEGFVTTVNRSVVMDYRPEHGAVDTDDDGLSDALERTMCTDPLDPDSDRDGLLDGWELSYVIFDDWPGRYGYGDIDFPALGADPCRRDVFLQLDWEEGVAFRPEEIQYVINEFRRIRISLHITGEERVARPGDDAVRAATRDNGVLVIGSRPVVMPDGTPRLDYYFRPLYNWTHFYGYARNERGPSHSQGHYLTLDMTGLSSAERISKLLHQLGHCLGLGHGGRDGHTQVRDGDFVEYVGFADTINNKPNYVSVMNHSYAAGMLWFNTATYDIVGDIGFTRYDMPELNEANLDETITGPMSQALQNIPSLFGPNFVPTIIYSVLDDGVAFEVLTDGVQTLARRRSGGDWEFNGWVDPIEPGIDWDGNAVIESSTHANINGGRGELVPSPFDPCNGVNDNPDDGEEIDEGCPGTWLANELLQTRTDWNVLPGRRRCPHLVDVSTGAYLQDENYRILMGPGDSDIYPGSMVCGAPVVKGTSKESTDNKILGYRLARWWRSARRHRPPWRRHF
jgi:hypothetical protein